MSKLTIYHGSPEIIEKPQFGKGKPTTITVEVFTAQNILSLQKNGLVPKMLTAL